MHLDCWPAYVVPVVSSTMAYLASSTLLSALQCSISTAVSWFCEQSLYLYYLVIGGRIGTDTALTLGALDIDG